MANTLTHSPARIIRQLLIDLGLGSNGGTWPVFYAMEPNAPDNCISVFDTTGTSDGRSMIDGELFGHEGFQVRVRAQDHDTGWTKADAIQKGLAEDVSLETVTVASSRYTVYAVTRISDVLPLGRQVPQSMRSIFTINATLAVNQVA